MTTENSSTDVSTNEVTTDVVSTTPETTTNVVTPQEATPSTPQTNPDGTLAATAPLPPAFTPNFKFKVMGKELEMADWAKGIIKDAETEKKVRDVFEKAHGLDIVKERYEKRQQEFSQKENYYANMDKVVGNVQHFMQAGDYDNLFGKAGLDVNFDQLVNWMNKKLEALQQGPQALAQIDEQAKIRQQNYLLSQENNTYQSQVYNQAVQARGMQLDTLLSRNDVSTFASTIDSKMGQIGYFRDLVVQEGINAHYMSQGQKDLTVEEAINNVVQKYSKLIGGEPAMSNQQTPQVQAQQMPGQKPPVIPVIGGKGTSPVKKSFKSLQELKEHARSL
jgi:hypothetical protein